MIPEDDVSASCMQREITRICAEVALQLFQHGGDSDLIVRCSRRIGKALGIDKVECLLTANGLVLTTRMNNHCLTTTRRCHSQGVNFSVVLQIQRIVINAERHAKTLDEVKHALQQIDKTRYPTMFTAFMVAISCASFARLSGGDWVVMLVTFVAAFVGIRVRQILHSHHFNTFLIFIGSAFFSTLVTATAFRFNLGNDPHYAIASAVLLLVPGVPLVNAVSDVLRNHTNIGFGRWIFATIVTLGACIGIAAGLLVMNINLQEMFYG